MEMKIRREVETHEMEIDHSLDYLATNSPDLVRSTTALPYPGLDWMALSESQFLLAPHPASVQLLTTSPSAPASDWQMNRSKK
jgi:hypothetical protein